MKKLQFLTLVIFATFLIQSCGTSSSTTETSTPAKAPTMSASTQTETTALVDREIFFGNPEISGGQLSPDGKFVSFSKEHNGIMNVWVKAFDEPFSSAKLLTESSSPILGYFWTRDSKYILYINDTGGNENFNIFAVDPSAPAVGLVPESRNLTNLEDVTAQIYSVSRNNPDMLMIGLNDRDKAWHDLYKLTISTGKLEKILENTNRYVGFDFDWDENMRLAYRSTEEGFSQILRVDPDGSFKELYETNLQEQAYVAGWTPDNSECYLVSNKGDIDKSTLFKMNPQTGEVVEMESDPKDLVDFGSLWVNSETREIISSSYTYDKRVRYFKNKEWENRYNYLKSQFPNREVGFSSFTKDYDKMLVSVSGDKYATEVYFFDPATKELILQYTPRPALKKVENALSNMQPITYKSSDGLDIPAYLSIPAGKEAKNLPVVVVVHGGPKGPRDYWGYNGEVQFLTNRGYAVLQPNFRASGGYGKHFLNVGDKQWGKLMQDDITWGVKHLVSQGIADPDRVAIMGGSYGGYATLAGLAFTPDVYKCGVDIVGPSNLFTLLESIPAYWEAGRKWLYEMVGDPETEEGKALLTAASPLFHVDKITKPLLIIQGANDPRVKKAESDQIVIALRDKGHPVDYILADDEGHGFRKPLNRMAMYAQVEKFLATHLGGRYQKEMPVDVAETLAKLTVDINTVALMEKKEAEVISDVPSVKYDWKAGSNNYDGVISVQGQNINTSTVRTIEKTDTGWMVQDKTTTPMGAATDEIHYDANFKAIKRNISQMGQNIKIDYMGNKLKVDMAGNESEIEADGFILADGPGYDMLLASMGMSEGDSRSLFTIDMMSGKPKEMIVSHMGTESVDGVDYELIKMFSSENENDYVKFWMDSAKKEMYKMEQIIPAMGNAKLVSTRK